MATRYVSKYMLLMVSLFNKLLNNVAEQIGRVRVNWFINWQHLQTFQFISWSVYQFKITKNVLSVFLKEPKYLKTDQTFLGYLIFAPINIVSSYCFLSISHINIVWKYEFSVFITYILFGAVSKNYNWRCIRNSNNW